MIGAPGVTLAVAIPGPLVAPVGRVPGALREHRLGLLLRDLVVRGSIERLSPVLMTALAAGLALTPLLFGAGEPGREILHPVAVTIFGGLISATLIDTFLTPIMFLKFGEKPLERLRAATQQSPEVQGKEAMEAY